MTWPHDGDDEKCPFIHDNIDKLVGVEPMPIDQLPKTCVCGRPLTYADEVLFISIVTPQPPPKYVSVVVFEPVEPTDDDDPTFH